MNRDNFADHRTQVVHFMDHIEQDRAAARFFAPDEGTIEIAIGFIECRAAHHGNESTEDSGLDDLDCLMEDPAMAAMVSH